MNAEGIFLAALEKQSASERRAFLESACGDDVDLKARVEGLLVSHQEAGSFLDAPLFDSPPTIDQPVAERPGMQIGPYKLLQQIGEGGFGVVFMAEQSQPVRRRVALKVIKPGMDTRQVIARFEAERQALAMMDHPNIARVMDAGATASGRPYFVMELVRGVPITAHCDQNSLPIRDRLELFAAVCQAIQHAHQKGIIHRDIKPSNVLVTAQDGQAVVKVIDFGVAKAMGQQLTDKTLFTDFAQMIGTPLYMSPEQAERSGTDIDTRSDIYSLGVLLYELLTGSTPVDKEQMKRAAFDEIRRIIREDEPEKPSTRISSAEAAPSIAAQRHTEPGRLARLVRGELDWIVMKALEKDRNRRYETASAFAKDVEHFLHDEQVAACPPSSVYRLRKFARRNKAALATAAVIAAALVVGTAVSTWQAIRATTAERLAGQRLVREKQATAKAIAAGLEAEKQRVKAQESFQEAQSQRRIAEENYAKAKAAVERYFVQVSDSHLLKAAGLQPLRRELLAAALEFYAELTQQRSNDAALMAELADAHYRAGRVFTELGSGDEARQAYGKARGLYEVLLKERAEDVELAHAHARCMFWLGATAEAIASWEKLIQRAPLQVDIRRELANAYNSAAITAKKAGQPAEALQWHEKAHAIREQLAAAAPDSVPDRYALGQTLNNIAVLLAGRDADSLALYRRALEHGQFAHDRAPLNLAYGRLVGTAQANIASCEGKLGSSREAVDSYQRAIAVWKKLAFDNPAVPDLYANLVANYRRLAFYQRDVGRAEEWTATMRLAQQVLERFPKQSATDLYNFACLHAVSSALSAKDPLTASPQELIDAQKEMDREAKEAVAALDQAIAAGFSDLTLLQIDRDLDSLRARNDFRELLTKLDDTLKTQQVAKAEQDRGAQLEALVKSATLGASPESLEAGRTLLALRQSLANEKPERLDRQADVAATQHTIGLIQLSLGQLDEAGRSLVQAEATRQDLVTAEPDKRLYQADLAATRLALGDLDWKANRLAAGAARWQQALALLESVVAAEPTNNRYVSQLAAAASAIGSSYGEIGLWNEAADHYAKAFAAQPSGNSYDWVPVGYLSLWAGDRESFRRVCTQALERAKGNVDRRLISDLTGCISLSPEGLIESTKLVEMAKQVLAVEPTAGWRRFRVALAQYRAGQDQEALKTLEGFTGYSESWPVAAMIYHRLGQPERARDELDKSDRQFERVMQQTLSADSLKFASYSWLHWVLVQNLRREAHALLDGRPLVVSPLEHLLWARAYAKVGEQGKSDAAFQALVDSAEDDPQALLAQVQVLDQLGRHELAEAAFQRIVALQPNDSRPWIARARQLIAQDKRSAADEAFTKAAEASPDELHYFLEAGWWASAEPAGAGPLAAADAAAGRVWHDVPSADWGRVGFQNVPAVKALPTAYAVNYVYSPDLRSVTLLVGSADRVRLELNGELIYDGGGRSWEWALIQVPALLRPGRNTFVATALQPDHWHAFVMRIADSPFDRGYLLAQLGQWDEALALWTPLLTAHPPDQSWIWFHYAGMLLAQGQTEAYRRACREMLARPVPNSWDRNRVPAACALAPLDESAAARLVQMIDENGPSEGGGLAWQQTIKALVYYRAKRFQEMLALLDDPEAKPDWLRAEVYVLRALCRHGLGDATAARAELQKADGCGAALFAAQSGTRRAPIFTKYNGMLEPIGFFVLSREAHRLITSDAPPHDRSLAELTAEVRGALGTAAPLTAPYDRAILFEPDQTRHWLGRYRARVAAGQVEQAERDLEQLVRAEPAKPDGWNVRGGLYAALGRSDLAAADFAKALALTPDKDIWFAGPRRRLCAQLAQWPDVFANVQKQFPHDDALWIGRAFWHAQHSRWSEAAADFARVSEADLMYDECCSYAGCRLLAGQAKESREISEGLVERISGLSDKNPWVGLYLAKICTLSPDVPADSQQVIEWAEQGRAAKGSPGIAHLSLGLAYYRAGEWERAIPVLSETARIWQYGRQPVEKHQVDLVLAMCDFQLGRTDQARQRLKASCDLIDRAVPYTSDNPFAIHVPNWIMLNILRREAEALLKVAK
jgi:serine/threonine protein kinase/tetratricopeptide (TPR) repeat protein